MALAAEALIDPAVSLEAAFRAHQPWLVRRLAFVVGDAEEARDLAQQVRSRSGVNDVFVAGRRKTGWIDEVKREASAVETALAEGIATHGWTVTPVICVHRADLPWFRSEVVGVRIASGKQLVKRLRKADPVLSSPDVERLAALAAARLRPAVLASPTGASAPDAGR